MSAVIRETRFLAEPLVLSRKAVKSADAEDRSFASDDVRAVSRAMPTGKEGRGAGEMNPPFERMLTDALVEGNATTVITAAEGEEREAMLRKEVESARLQAKEQGYREGHDAGLERGAAEFREKISALRTLIETAQAAVGQTIEGCEDAVVEIAFEAVRKILGVALADRKSVSAIVKQVIAQAKERERLVIRVSPADFAMLDENELFTNAGLSDCELLPDERVVLGGCLLEAAGGNLDGRLETQLQQFREVLLNARTRQPDEETA